MGHVLLEQPGTVENLFLALPLNKQMPLKKHWPQKDAPDTDIHWPELLSGQGLVAMNNWPVGGP